MFPLLAILALDLPAQDPSLDFGEYVTISINPEFGVPAEDLLRIAAQVLGGVEVRTRKGSFRDKLVRLAGATRLTRAEFFTFAQTMLYRLDLSCIDHRPKGKKILELVERKQNEWRVNQDPKAVYVSRDLGSYRKKADVTVVTSIRLTHEAQTIATEFLERLRDGKLEIGVTADGKSIILQGPGPVVYDASQLVAQIDVPREKPLVKVASGFEFVEGPAWNPHEGDLLFSDIPNDKILRLDSENRVTTFLKPSERANGLVFDSDGNLYACLGGGRKVVRIAPDGRHKVLASHFAGKKLNSPNDLALDGEGGVYFTDPRYGESDDVEQEVMGVYYIAASGKVARVIDGLRRPNGVVFARLGPNDRGHLYVSEPDKREIHRFPILSPGKLGTGHVFFRSRLELDGSGPDGMAVDEHGNVYATYRNLLVLSPPGKVLRRIPVAEKPSNCGFGGADGKTLFITARTSLYRGYNDIAGAGPIRPFVPLPKQTPPFSGAWSLEFSKMVPERACAAALFRRPGAKLALERVLAGAFDENGRKWLNARFAEADAKKSLRSHVNDLGNELEPGFGIIVRENNVSRGGGARNGPQWAFVFQCKTDESKKPRQKTADALGKLIHDNQRTFGVTSAFILGTPDKTNQFYIDAIPGTGEITMGIIGRYFLLCNSELFLQSIVSSRESGGGPRKFRSPKPRKPDEDGPPAQFWIDEGGLESILKKLPGIGTRKGLENARLDDWIRFSLGRK